MSYNIDGGKKMKKICILLLASAILVSCASIPDGAKAVEGFEVDRYLGKWYEIARFDFRFEKDLDNTTAEYSLNDDGSVRVVNRGYNYVKGESTEAIGKAKFRGESDIAELKVSFFGPFYSGYNVIAIDQDYRYALVVGNDTGYLWILSREKTIPDDVKAEFLGIAESIGCDTSDLVWVEHD